MAKTTKKKHQNLDEMHEHDVHVVAKKLKIPLLDHKTSTLKQLIRLKWKKNGIEELPVQGLIKAHKNKPKGKTVKENYQFTRKFTNEELGTKSMALSGACIERNNITDEFKAVKKEYSGKIDAQTAIINQIANELQKGSETVLKTCEVLYDYDKAIKIYSYEGTEVGRERMTKKDYQLEANFE